MADPQQLAQLSMLLDAMVHGPADWQSAAALAQQAPQAAPVWGYWAQRAQPAQGLPGPTPADLERQRTVEYALRPGAPEAPPWWWEKQQPGGTTTSGAAEALPLGDLMDPVSSAAFMLAPGVQRGLGRLGRAVDQGLLSGPPQSRLRLARGERGNLGPPPVSATGEPLPASVVRDEAGNLRRLYHGTPTAFEDFELSKLNPQDWAKGIFMTDNPTVAGGPPTVTDPFQMGYASRNLSTRGVMDMQLREQEARAAGHLSEARYWAQQIEQDVRQHASSNVRPVYADLKQPLDLDAVLPPEQALPILRHIGFDAAELQEMLQQTPGRGLSGRDIYDLLAKEQAAGTTGANQILAREGFDGLTEFGGGATFGQPHRTYVSFSPEHIYPSFNVDALRQGAGGP